MSGLDLLVSQSALWYMLLVAVLIGACLGVFCDGLFIIRLTLHDPMACGDRRHSVGHAILRGACDFASALVATVLLLLLCYYTSDGQLRAPAIFGMIAGFWIYRKTVSHWLRRLLVAVFRVIQKILRFLWDKTLGRLARAVKDAALSRIRRSATERQIRILTDEASRGFGMRDEQKRN